MKFTLTRFLLLVAIAALLATIPAIASAQPATPPHKISGNASIDGRLAAPGTEIQALAADGTVLARVAVSVLDTTINYSINVPQPSGGDLTISFKVGGYDATPSQVVTWQQGQTTYPVNLSASRAAVTQPTPEPTPATTEAPPTPVVVRGERGERGPEGPAGPAGPEGPAGPAGPAGPQGPAGPEGDTGPQGPRGLPGEQGSDGADGPQGIPGAAGAAGPAGPAGPKGERGETGQQGATGASGSNGAAGPAGPQGSSGNFLIAIIALVVALLALLVAIGRWILELNRE